jgi:hypothetical protein
LALALAALFIWRFEAAWNAAAAVGGVATLGVAWTEARLGSLGSALDPTARLALWLGLLPLFILAALALFRWFEASVRLAPIRGRGGWR